MKHCPALSLSRMANLFASADITEKRPKRDLSLACLKDRKLSLIFCCFPNPYHNIENDFDITVINTDELICKNISRLWVYFSLPFFHTWIRKTLFFRWADKNTSSLSVLRPHPLLFSYPFLLPCFMPPNILHRRTPGLLNPYLLIMHKCRHIITLLCLQCLSVLVFTCRSTCDLYYKLFSSSRASSNS